MTVITTPRTDVITDVLRSIRLQGTLYFEAQLTAPWGIHIADTGFANFHQVTEGSCFLAVDSGPWVELREGETVVLPQGSTHSLCNEPGDGVIDGQLLFDRVDDDGVARLGGQGSGTTLICGHFSYDRELSHPLLQALPPVIRGDGRQQPGWTNLAQIAVARSKGLAPGAQALTDRLAEVLLIELLSELDNEQSGFIAALADPTVAAALHAIHSDPARDWTVSSLAGHVAASRSTLASRFTELIGESPIRYLTLWRMHQGARLLRETTLPAARIAELVGYSTPFSFTKAFVRELGVPPTTYRAGSHEHQDALR
ncbi:MAG: AraC family transcriptional regulator [Acidimicrobiales bacterium]